MIFRKHDLGAGDVVVKVSNSFGRFDEIIIRNTNQEVKLGNQDYVLYRIVRPEGYEKEKIVYRIGQGREGLICSVMMTLAQTNGRALDR
jgi:hypothetical protein